MSELAAPNIEQENTRAYKIEVHDPKKEPWKKIGARIMQLETSDPDIGSIDEEDMKDGFTKKDHVRLLIKDQITGEIAGFMWACPIDYEHEDRKSESKETAYIEDTVIAKEARGKGLVKELNRTMEDELRRREFKFIERDTTTKPRDPSKGYESSYAATIRRMYGERIKDSNIHGSKFGEQEFFRIEI